MSRNWAQRRRPRRRIERRFSLGRVGWRCSTGNMEVEVSHQRIPLGLSLEFVGGLVSSSSLASSSEEWPEETALN